MDKYLKREITDVIHWLSNEDYIGLLRKIWKKTNNGTNQNEVAYLRPCIEETLIISKKILKEINNARNCVDFAMHSAELEKACELMQGVINKMSAYEKTDFSMFLEDDVEENIKIILQIMLKLNI